MNFLDKWFLVVESGRAMNNKREVAANRKAFFQRLPEDVQGEVRAIAERDERTILITTGRLLREALEARKRSGKR